MSKKVKLTVADVYKLHQELNGDGDTKKGLLNHKLPDRKSVV